MLDRAIQNLFNYHHWALDRVWQCVLTLDDARFTQESTYSIGSVRNHLVHLLSVDARWLARVTDQPTPERLKAEDFPAVASAHAVWQAHSPAQRALVAGLSDERLAGVITYDITQHGGVKHSTRFDILTHVVNHGTDHRAQVLSLLYQLGAPTVEQDLIYYQWERV